MQNSNVLVEAGNAKIIYLWIQYFLANLHWWYRTGSGFEYGCHRKKSSVTFKFEGHHFTDIIISSGFIVFQLIHLSSGRCGCDFKSVNFKHNSGTDILSIQMNITLEWLSNVDSKSTLIWAVAWCHQAASHYLKKCWQRSLLSDG